MEQSKKVFVISAGKIKEEDKFIVCMDFFIKYGCFKSTWISLSNSLLVVICPLLHWCLEIHSLYGKKLHCIKKLYYEIIYLIYIYIKREENKSKGDKEFTSAYLIWQGKEK